MQLDLTHVKRNALIAFSALSIASAAIVPTTLAAPATSTTLTPATTAVANPAVNRGCPVEDEHGNVTYVAPGTVVGLFHCGSDGVWHWGWFVQ